MKETMTEISLRRLHWVKPNQRLATSCLIRDSSIRPVALERASPTMKITTYMISPYSRTGLQRASTKTSSVRLAKAPLLTSSVTMMAMTPSQMLSKCYDKRHNVALKAVQMLKEGQPQLRRTKESLPAQSQLSLRGVPWVKMQLLARAVSNSPQRELVTLEMSFLTSIYTQKSTNLIKKVEKTTAQNIIQYLKI